MATNLTKEIAEKAAMLPDDLQTEALRFVESLLAQQKNGRGERQPFESVKGILHNNYDSLEEDIGEMRREALKNFLATLNYAMRCHEVNTTLRVEGGLLGASRIRNSQLARLGPVLMAFGGPTRYRAVVLTS